METRRQCTGKSKQSGERCKRRPIPGGMVCVIHGGGTPAVRAKAAERLADLIDPDRVLREAARVAYSDLREVFDEQGKLRPLQMLPDHVAAAIASVEVVRQNLTPDDDQQEWVHKIKVWDKPKALDMLMRHLALYKDRLQVDIPQAEALVARLTAGRERVARERKRSA